MRAYAKGLWVAGALLSAGFSFTGFTQAAPIAGLAGAAAGVQSAQRPLGQEALTEKAYYRHYHYHYHHHYYHHYRRRW